MMDDRLFSFGFHGSSCLEFMDVLFLFFGIKFIDRIGDLQLLARCSGLRIGLRQDHAACFIQWGDEGC